MPYDSLQNIGRLLLAVLVVALALVGSASQAYGDDRAPVPRNAASLDDALVAVQRSHPGRVLKVELESEDDGPAGWVYEVKLLTRDGHVIEVKLDAVTLEVVGVEGGQFHDSNDD